MRSPLVSVITPSFNRADFINDTILSVCAQKFPHVEHIVIDGASSDGTVDILKAHAKRRSLRYLSEPDNGMYDALNKGLSMAQGEILCYLNTDDRYFPWSIETAVRFLEENRNVDIVYGDSLVIDVEKKLKTINILPSYGSIWLRCGGIIPQPTVFFRRKVYTEVGAFQRDVKYLADCEYWLRADRMGMRIKKINELLAVEFNHPGTIRQKLSAIIFDEKDELLAKYAPSICSFSWLRSVVKRLKYIEKEWLMIRFILGNRFLRYSNMRQWQAFRTSYSTKISLLGYYLDKALRTKSDIWQLEKRHG